MPISVVEGKGGVSEAVAADSTDNEDDGSAFACGEQFYLFLGILGEDEVGIVVGQFLHRGEGAELVAGLHGLVVFLVINKFQTVVFGEGWA